MQQLTKSLGSLTWALPLFGVQQVSQALRRSSDGTLGGDAAQALDAVTKASIEQCTATTRETFEIGDKLQRELVDLVFRLLPSSGLGDAASSAVAALPNPIQVVQRLSGQANASPHQAPDSLDEAELGWGPVPPID